jgi:Fe-S-cluster containining protein
MARYVRVTGEDHARLRPEDARLVVFHENRCFMRMTEGHCAALARTGGEWLCSIYERRPQLCRDFERGGPACEHERAVRGIA